MAASRKRERTARVPWGTSDPGPGRGKDLRRRRPSASPGETQPTSPEGLASGRAPRKPGRTEAFERWSREELAELARTHGLPRPWPATRAGLSAALREHARRDALEGPHRGPHRLGKLSPHNLGSQGCASFQCQAIK